MLEGKPKSGKRLACLTYSGEEMAPLGLQEQSVKATATVSGQR